MHASRARRTQIESVNTYPEWARGDVMFVKSNPVCSVCLVHTDVSHQRRMHEPRRGDNIIKLAGLNITQPSLGAMMPPTRGAASKRNELPVCGGQHDASRPRPAAASQVKITALHLGKTATFEQTQGE
jgi:hypothetical protein